MGLSSEDIVNWQLKTGMRGYLIPQVDELLDEVADELDRLMLRIGELEAEREAVRSSLDDQFEVEETLRRTLYQAQRAADQTIEDAKAEAARIVEQATKEAAGILARTQDEAGELYAKATRDATRERATVRAQLEAEEARMRARRQGLRKEIERLVGIEVETRSLLSGLYEDRLQELKAASVDLSGIELTPSVEEDVDRTASAPAAGPAAANAGDGAELEDAGSDDPATSDQVVDEVATAAPAPAPPLMDSEDSPATAARRGSVRTRDGSPVAIVGDMDPSASQGPLPTVTATDGDLAMEGIESEDVAADVEQDDLAAEEVRGDDAEVESVPADVADEAELADVADVAEVADEAGVADVSEVAEVANRPAYLEAVDEAVATINANDEADTAEHDALPVADGTEADGPDEASVGDDLVDDLVDLEEAEDLPSGDAMVRPDNLFDDAPRRRRRRSG